MSSAMGIREQFIERVGPIIAETLFDSIPDIVFFVKDINGRYVSVNQTLVERCGFSDKRELIGRTASEVFPPSLGDAFTDQDRQILSGGPGFRNHLELQLFSPGRQGWCLTNKEAVRTTDGKIVGVCGISRDLHPPSSRSTAYEALSKVLDFIHTNYADVLRLPQLAEMAGLSVYQFDQRIRSLFQVSAGQYLVKVRIDAACQKLANSKAAIAEIAMDCGYSDQSAFSRQFKQAVGVSPKTYRAQAHARNATSGIKSDPTTSGR